MDNKHLALSSLKINLPDGKEIQSTHVCDINISGLSMVLTGHIVPSLTIASLIGMTPLCKAGCKVIFNNEKCEVVFNGEVILTGYKNPSTDLWTLPIPKGRLWTSPSLATIVSPDSPHMRFSHQVVHSDAPYTTICNGPW